MKTVLILLTSISLFFSALTIAAVGEPGYLDFSNSHSNSSQSAATLNGNYNNGIFEPGYLNYEFAPAPFDPNRTLAINPTAAGNRNTKVNGHINTENGVFEPGYLNYEFD